MTRDPLADVVDAPLFVVPRVLDGLRAYRQRPKPGKLGAHLDLLTDRLLAGVEAHPTRFWVMKQFQKTLEAASAEDPGARAQLGIELEKLMHILGIDASDGLPST
jgi:thiamine monophosphate kinase